MESATGHSLTATRVLLVLVRTIKNGSRNQLQLVSAQCLLLLSHVQRVRTSQFEVLWGIEDNDAVDGLAGVVHFFLQADVEFSYVIHVGGWMAALADSWSFTIDLSSHDCLYRNTHKNDRIHQQENQ